MCMLTHAWAVTVTLSLNALVIIMNTQNTVQCSLLHLSSQQTRQTIAGRLWWMTSNSSLLPIPY